MKILHSNIFGSGKPLIIVHGFLGMGDNWKTLARRFSTTYEVHLVDQRNHGRSFHTEVFNYEVMVEDLWHYINYYQLEQIVILGHSMGGKTAMLFATSYPEKVTQLIVADIGPKFYPRHHDTILEGLSAVNFSKQKSRNEVDEILEAYIPEIGIRQFLLKNIYWKTKETLAFRFNLSSLLGNLDEIGEALPSFAIFEGKTLFLRGENSAYISAEDIPLIKTHFPNAHVVTVKNSGHWLHAENPNDFYDHVVSFLA